LLGLEIPDERFEPPRRLAELAHHPFVVGPLVANFSKQLSTFSRLPVDLGLFLLGLGPKAREFVPPCFLPLFSIREPVRGYTILLNHPGVQSR